jgi:6-phosphofructokinase
MVRHGIVDARSTNRILVVESFGRSAGFAPLRIGSLVKASRTLIPEEKDLDFEKILTELSDYHKKHGYAVVIVSEGVKINRTLQTMHFY